MRVTIDQKLLEEGLGMLKGLPVRQAEADLVNQYIGRVQADVKEVDGKANKRTSSNK
jgi:hypothetical protein